MTRRRHLVVDLLDWATRTRHTIGRRWTAWRDRGRWGE